MRRGGSNSILDPDVFILAGDWPSGAWSAVTHDDDYSGLDARCVFWATAGQRYTAELNTYSSGDYGTYSYSIQEVNSASASASQTPPAGKPSPVDLTAKLRLK
jgi:hypothetical protein